MAITWGSKVSSSSGNYMRLGYELTQSPSSVGTGTASVTVTLKVYVNTRYPVSDSSNSFSITGNFSQSGSEDINHGGNDDVTLLQTETRTVTTSYTSTVKSSFSASLSGINAIPGTASVSGSITTGKRPISAPWAPNSPTVTRTSDTSHTVRWTNDNPTDPAHPYQNLEVQRWDNVGNSWATIATLGVVSSYTNTSTRADRQYRWRVRAKNSAGASGYVYTGYWSTTPASPNTPTASKITNDVKLTWTNRATKGTNVEVWHAANGVWDGSALAVLAGQPTTYTHANPDPTKTHAYRLKAQAGTADDAPTTYSAFSGTSNTIQLLTSPAAPTKLSPTSGVRDADAAAITLSWQHNEVDGTAQTKYDLQYRLNGGAWTTVSASSTTQSRTFAAGTLPNGSIMDWQVRTYGQYATAPAYSPWSAMATLTLSATPQAGVVFPDDVTPVDTSRITAQWSYYDEEGTGQAQWKVNLYSAGGGAVLETRTGVGTETSVPLTTLLRNNTAYRLGVSVQDGSGLWSPETTQDFTVSYALPDVPTVALSWDDSQQAVVASIGNPTGGTGAEVDHNELWRSVDWETYELVADAIPPNGTVTDYIPALGSENVYKVIAVTAIEAAAESVPAIFEAPALKGWFLINGGDAFATRVGVRYNPALSRTFNRDKALNKFAGRKYPVETAGEGRNRVFDLSVSVFGDDDASLAALEAMADIPGPLVLRTPMLDRAYVSLEGIPSTRAMGGFENVSLKMTQVDAPNTGSMVFDPVVYRTNWADRPVALDAAFGTYSTGTGGVYAVTYRADGEDGPLPGLNQYARVTATTPAASGSGGWQNSNDATKADPVVGVTGDQVTISLYTRYTGSAPSISRTLRVYLYMGTTVVGSVNATTSLQNGVWTRQVATITAPADFDNVRYWQYFSGGDPLPVGSTLDVTGYMVETAGQVGSYFDGNTTAEPSDILRNRWTGTPYQSTSTLTRGGTP